MFCKEDRAWAMNVIAYSYTDPFLESVPEAAVWGWEVDRVYQDVGDRHQLEQLLRDCRQTPVDYVLVRRLIDLGDSVQAVSHCLAELEGLGIHLIAVEEAVGADDQTLRRSQLVHLLSALQASQRSRQIRQGHARNRVQALPPPGKAPYGYRRGKDRYTIDRATAPVVKDFFEHFILYGSLRGSVRYLQQTYNKTISVSTGKRWLTSPVYRGDLAYHNGDVVPDTHTPIISRQEAAQVDRLLRRNRQLAPRTASAPRSLAGLVTCAQCQSPMTVTRVAAPRQAHEYLYLRPTQCPNRPRCRAVPYADVLHHTIQRICDDLPRAVGSVPMPDMEAVKHDLTAQVATRQRVLDQLPALIETGVLDAATAQLRTYTLQTEIATLQARLAQLPPVNLKAIAQVVSLPQFWLDLSESERRFYFREFIHQIQLVREGSAWSLQLVFIF